MDRLEGYNTNGHEYRKSQIDRSNSRRLKWLMNEAKKNLKQREKEQIKENTNFVQKNNLLEEKDIDNKKNINSSNPDNIFKPNGFNLFSRSNANNPFNKKH